MIEIRHNIFIRKIPERKFQVSVLPEGVYMEGMNEEDIFKVGYLTICTDPIEVILWETCNQMFGRVPFNDSSFSKARNDYKMYTKNVWDSRQFYKR